MTTDAAALAGDKLIAIWPTKGWWSDHASTRGNASIRYAFVVTIDTGNADVDLYALIEARLNVMLRVDVDVE